MGANGVGKTTLLICMERICNPHVFARGFTTTKAWNEVVQFRNVSIEYFPLTAGYNTCYCNNIAPSETGRICRKVDAHRKEAQSWDNRTPAQQEYDQILQPPEDPKTVGQDQCGRVERRRGPGPGAGGTV